MVQVNGRGARPHSNVSQQLIRRWMDLLSLLLQSRRHCRFRRAWAQAWGGHRRVVRVSHTPKTPTSRKSAMVSRLWANPSIHVKAPDHPAVSAFGRERKRAPI